MSRTDAYDFVADHLPSAVLADIDAFWGWFSEQAPALDLYFTSQGAEGGVDPVDVMAPMTEKFPDLMWEFGPSDKGHRLIITAEWQDEHRPLARAFGRRAPNLDRWEFLETRPPEDMEYLIQNFEARFQTKLSLTEMTASVGENGRIDLDVKGHGDEQDLLGQALSLGTLLLGEEDDRDWLGIVTPTSVKKTGGLMARLRGKSGPAFDLKAARDSLVGAIKTSKAARPAEPRHQIDIESQPYTMFQPTDAPEEFLRADLITYLAPSERFGQAVLGGERFSSATHSAFGETFVALRIPNQNGTAWASADRGELEELIHLTLSKDGIGGYIAGGSGTQAAYIDVALNDVTTGLALLAQALRSMAFAKDTTFHFLDPGLTDTAYPLLGDAASFQ